MALHQRYARIAVVTAIMGLCGVARAAINEFDLFRVANYTQSDAVSAPSLDGYTFSSNLAMDNPTDFDGGTLVYPGPDSPGTYTLINSPGDTFLNFQSSTLPDQATLDADFPTGTYTATATNSSTSAQQTTAQTYSVDAYSHTIPALTSASFTALQGMNPSQSQTVSFNSFVPDSNATEPDIFFTINDSSGNAVFNEGFLQPNVTSVEIPANTLSPLSDYTYTLIFSDRINSTNMTDGVLDVLGYDLSTSGSFTTGDVPEPASLAMLALGGAMLLRKQKPRTSVRG